MEYNNNDSSMNTENDSEIRHDQNTKEIVENTEERFKEPSKGMSSQDQANKSEAKTNECQGEGDREALSPIEENDSTEANVKDINNIPEYSSVFQAQYPQSDAGAFGSEKRKGGTKSKITATAIISTCIVLSMLIGTIGGIMSTVFLLRSGGYDIVQSGDRDDPTVTKNDGSINVNEIIDSTGHSNLSVADVVELVGDSVVQVVSDEGVGSGVIFTQGGGYGYIVTNHHVVNGSSRIMIVLTDGTQMEASLLDADAQTDIAVLRVTTDRNLTVATLGSSKDLCVGQTVIAIGNPLGTLGGTVTDGIISATDRSIEVDGITMTLLQTNAAINPGNSGGGLFNTAGELIGVVNAKKSAEGIEGLGFAIPVDSIYDMIVGIVRDGYVKGRITLDIEVDLLTAAEARSFCGINKEGVYVIGSTSDTLSAGDLIVKINSTQIDTETDYYAVLNSIEIGQTVEVYFYRSNGFGVYSYKATINATEYVPLNFS